MKFSRGWHYGWVITATYFMVMTAAWGTQGAFGPFINPITDEMGWSRGTVSGVSSINILISMIVGAFWGWLSDRWSVKGVIFIAGLLMGIGVFFSNMITSLWHFYLLFGFLAGIGLGGTPGPMAGITSRWFDKHRGLALGLGLAGIHGGVAIVPILAEYLISSGGWRLGFMGLGIVIWVLFLISALLIKEPKLQTETLRSTIQSSDDSNSVTEALRTPAFWILFGMTFIGFMVCIMTVVHLVPRAEDIGVGSSTAVTLLTVIGGMAALGTLGGGGLGDKIGPHRVFVASLSIVSVALLWLAFSTELWMLYVFAAVFGLGYGGWTPIIAAIAGNVFGTRHLGGIYGSILLGGGLGGMLGPLMAGYIFDATGAYLIAFLLGSGISVLAVLMALCPGGYLTAKR